VPNTDLVWNIYTVSSEKQILIDKIKPMTTREEIKKELP
jgi:hypothetical protein